MKLKVSVKLTEQKSCGNAHCKYAIRGFDRHIPYAVDVYVSAVLFFVLFLHFLFEDWRNTKMKLKVSREWTEQKNCGSADRKYTIRGSNGTYPTLFLLIIFYFLCCC